MAERIYLQTLFNGTRVSCAFKKLMKRIEAGEIFIYPTETIYGIGGRADSEDVRRRIIHAKARDPENPMILLAGAKQVFLQFGVAFPQMAELLAKHFWPGRMTLVLPLKNKKETIGVRVSDHPFMIALHKQFKLPIFSTSANMCGQAYTNAPDAIYSLFEQKIDFMIDAGTLPSSPPSTVVKILSDKKIELVREGVIKKEKILSVLVNHCNKQH